MSTYTNPYCSIDKLRISKANGIRFVYLTTEGSFFEGDLINDNTLYNDMSNCGFNWEPFAQPYPCNGVIRFQFKWCDEKQPLVHMFKNGEFYYEFVPTLVSDTNGDDIYEQEINLSGDLSLCDSCIDIRIATLVVGGLSLYVTNDKPYVRMGSAFSVTQIDQGYAPMHVSVFDGGAILLASDVATNSKVYFWDGSAWNLKYTTNTGVFNYVKAFSREDWVAVSNTTLGKAIFSKSGIITEEDIADPSTFYGIDGFDIDNIYALSQTPFANAKIFARLSGAWVIYDDFGANYGMPSGREGFRLVGNNIYTVIRFGGVSYLRRYGLAGGQDDFAMSSANPSFCDIKEDGTGICSDATNLYAFNGSSLTVDSGFATIRASKGDSSNIKTGNFQSDSIIYAATENRLYRKVDGVWSEWDGYSSSGGTVQVDGYYSTSHDYHAQSEPLGIKDYDCLVRVEYWNDDDYDQQVFCSGFRNVTYIKAQFLGFKPMESAVVYKTSNNNSRILSSNLAKISTLDVDYIPEYLHEILWRAFGFDNLTINGKSYTKEGEYVVQENSAKYSLWKGTVELYENLFKFTNSNCNRNCALSNESANECIGIGEMEIGTTFVVYEENSCLNI